MWSYFKEKNTLYNLRNTQLLHVNLFKIKTHGLKQYTVQGFTFIEHTTKWFLRKQNLCYNSKAMFEDQARVHVLAVQCFSFKVACRL